MNKVNLNSKTKIRMAQDKEVTMFHSVLEKGDYVQYNPKDPKGVRYIYKVISLDIAVTATTFTYKDVTVQKVGSDGSLMNTKFNCHISKVTRLWLQPGNRVSYKGDIYFVESIYINDIESIEVKLKHHSSNNAVRMVVDLDSITLLS